MGTDYSTDSQWNEMQSAYRAANEKKQEISDAMWELDQATRKLARVKKQKLTGYRDGDRVVYRTDQEISDAMWELDQATRRLDRVKRQADELRVVAENWRPTEKGPGVIDKVKSIAGDWADAIKTGAADMGETARMMIGGDAGQAQAQSGTPAPKVISNLQQIKTEGKSLRELGVNPEDAPLTTGYF